MKNPAIPHKNTAPREINTIRKHIIHQRITRILPLLLHSKIVCNRGIPNINTDNHISHMTTESSIYFTPMLFVHISRITWQLSFLYLSSMSVKKTQLSEETFESHSSFTRYSSVKFTIHSFISSSPILNMSYSEWKLNQTACSELWSFLRCSG